MDYIQVIAENEQVKDLYENNETYKSVLSAGEQAMATFMNFLPSYIHSRRDKFIGESGSFEEFKSNVRCFANAATTQFLTEIAGQMNVIIRMENGELEETKEILTPSEYIAL